MPRVVVFQTSFVCLCKDAIYCGQRSVRHLGHPVDLQKMKVFVFLAHYGCQQFIFGTWSQ